MVMFFREMQKDIHQNAIDHGWWNCKVCDGDGVVENQTCPVCKGSGKHRDHAESLALIHAEVSEALEALREPKKIKTCDKCNGRSIHAGEAPCGKCRSTGEALCGDRYAEELADVVIRVLDEAAARGIDLEAAINAKHIYNVTRPYKHGGKAF